MTGLDNGERGLENPGVTGGDSATSPWSFVEAPTSPGRALFNPFIQMFHTELWSKAVVHKLGCTLEAPVEL